MKHIFLDTNILIHFKPIEEIDWPEVSNCDTCILLISPIVIDELESKKIADKKSSRKINEILKKIEKYSSQKPIEIKKNVFVEIINKKPSNLTYDKFGLNFLEQDHRLFATIIEYNNRRQENDILLVSNDTGNRLRAKHYGINAIDLPNKYKLPLEIDSNEKKILQLEKEIQNLKMKVPKLGIVFENGEKYHAFDLKRNDLKLDNFIEAEMTKITEKFKHLKYENPEYKINNLVQLHALSQLNSITRDQVDNYNERLDLYFKNYQKFLNDAYEFIIKESLSITLELYLANSGNAPAEDIDIHFHFPDGFELFDYHDYQQPLKEPSPPAKPKSLLENIQSPHFQPYEFLRMPQQTPITDFRHDKPSIIKTNSYNVHYQIGKLKHFHKKKLDKLIVLFNRFEEIKSFNIQYKITAANIPQLTEGDLNIRMNA